MNLFRPIGLDEMRIVFESGLTQFPQRLPEQPIFYPVLSLSYADQIANEWNTKTGMLAGYVTAFSVDDKYVDRYESHIVGSREHLELWVPAEELSEFNRHITPPIRVVAAHFGDAFCGLVPTRYGLRGKNAAEQFAVLASTLDNSGMDFFCEVAANDTVVFLHYPFWQQFPSSHFHVSEELQRRTLDAIVHCWSKRADHLPLPEQRRLP